MRIVSVTEDRGKRASAIGRDWKRTYQRVFKVVSFYLVRYSAGRLGAIREEMRREVAEARWLPLAEADSLLSYKGEREMAAKARDMLPALCRPTR